jgi:hypothetical protein
MDLAEIGWGDVGWIGLSQDGSKRSALVNAVMNLRVPCLYATCSPKIPHNVTSDQTRPAVVRVALTNQPELCRRLYLDCIRLESLIASGNRERSDE